MLVTVLIFILLTIAVVTSTVASIWFLIEAFRVHILWGLALIFFPVLGILFAVLHWDTVKKPFLLNLLACLLIGVVVALALFQARAAAPGAAARASNTASFSLTEKIEEFKQAAVERKARKEIAARGFQGRNLADIEEELGAPQGRIMYDGTVEYKYTDRGLILISTNGVTVTDEIRE